MPKIKPPIRKTLHVKKLDCRDIPKYSSLPLDSLNSFMLGLVTISNRKTKCFTPVFRNKQHKVAYNRTIWEEAQKELDWYKESKG